MLKFCLNTVAWSCQSSFSDFDISFLQKHSHFPWLRIFFFHLFFLPDVIGFYQLDSPHPLIYLSSYFLITFPSVFTKAHVPDWCVVLRALHVVYLCSCQLACYMFRCCWCYCFCLLLSITFTMSFVEVSSLNVCPRVCTSAFEASSPVSLCQKP